MDETGALLPLEQLLFFMQQRRGRDLPHPANHYDRYRGLKDWLKKNVYEYVGSGSAANTEGAPFLTNHGIDHIDSVIRYAGKLAGIPDNPDELDDYGGLLPYEPFLMLCAILLHDAGNVYGRESHEKKPLELLKEIGELFSGDNFEKRLIADIAEVHGGRAPDGSRDTIGSKQWPDEDEFLSSRYRPKLVAAIVRFADEICEDRSRTSSFLLKTNAINDDSLTHHHYAQSIRNVRVDRKDKSVALAYDIEAKDVILQAQGQQTSLIDVILKRLLKMDAERRYCLRYMFDVAPIFKIRAEIQIRDDYSGHTTASLSLQDEGYPAENQSVIDGFFKENPELTREALIRRYGG